MPSAPGDLELQVKSRSTRVWVLADGRMITLAKDFATGAAAIAAAANPTASGYFEQRLSPEGVDLLRSYVVDNATATTPLGGPPNTRIQSDPLVAMENRIVIASVPGCSSWEGLPPHHRCRKPGSPTRRGPSQALSGSYLPIDRI